MACRSLRRRTPPRGAAARASACLGAAALLHWALLRPAAAFEYRQIGVGCCEADGEESFEYASVATDEECMAACSELIECTAVEFDVTPEGPRCELHKTNIVRTSHNAPCKCLMKAAPTLTDSVFKLVGLGGCRDQDLHHAQAYRAIQASGLEMCMADCVSNPDCTGIDWFPSSWAVRMHQHSRHGHNCQLHRTDVSAQSRGGHASDFHCYRRVSQRRRRRRRDVAAVTDTATAPAVAAPATTTTATAAVPASTTTTTAEPATTVPS